MSGTPLSRRSVLRSMALAAPFISLAGCGDELEPVPVPRGFEEDARLVERYYSPELIPHLQAVGTHHGSGRSEADIRQMLEHAVELLRADPDEETAFAAIDVAIIDDFRSLRVEDVAGWTLSQSETHLAVLALALG